MSVSDIRQNVPEETEASQVDSTAGEVLAQCGRCGARVDERQRYCLACGTHLSHAYDPAARYFSEFGGRARSARGRSVTAAPSARSGLALAIVLALIPVAAAIGVIAGRSSNNQDSRLIQALVQRAQPAQTAGVASSAGVSPGVRQARSSRKGAPHRRQTSRASVSSTRSGSAGQIGASKPTKAQVQQGAAAAQQVQKSTGKNYVNTQSNLPSQVVVP